MNDKIIVSFSREQLQNKCRKYCKQNSSVISCSDKQLIHCNLIFKTDFKIVKNKANISGEQK